MSVMCFASKGRLLQLASFHSPEYAYRTLGFILPFASLSQTIDQPDPSLVVTSLLDEGISDSSIG